MELIAREQLYIKSKSPELLKELKGLLCKPNPEFAKKKRMGLPTWDTPPRIIMYKQKGDYLMIPRGTGRMARDLAKKHGELFKFTDERTFNGNDIVVELNDNITPYWFQDEANVVMVRLEQGMVVAPCGSGKTGMGLILIAQVKKRTMVIVHTLDLLRQWVDRIGEFLIGDFTVGQFGGGKKRHGDITICMIQTLSKLSIPEWREFEKRYSICLGDESHHFGANTYMAVMERVRSRYVIGLTATPKRADKKDFVINAYLGPIIHTVLDSDLESSGRSVTCKVNFINTGKRYNFSKMGEQFSIYGTIISKDKQRNELIVNNICRDLDDGRVPMVLTERVYHAKYLISMLKEKGISVGSITGEVDSDTRERVKSQIINGELQVLIANKQIASEGLDVPPIDSVHVAFYTAQEGLLKQMVGRGRRVHGDKDYCRVWMYRDYVYKMELGEDFVEVPVEHKGMKYQTSKVKKYFRGLGFDVVDVEDTHDVL